MAVAVGFLVPGCANTGAKRQAAPPTADSPEPGKGLVIFYRESHFKAGAVGLIVRDLDEEPKYNPFKALSQPKIGGLPNGSYFVYHATPGEHIFAGSMMVMWEVGVSRELVDVYYCRVNIESNMTYYVRAELTGGSIGVPSYPSLGVMDSETGVAAIKNLKRVALAQ